MTLPETPVARDLTVQVSPRVSALLRVKTLVVLLIVAPLLFLISLIGTVVATATANATYLAYDAVDYDSASYDRLSSEWTAAVDSVEWWSILYDLAVPLLMVTILALVVTEIVTKLRRP